MTKASTPTTDIVTNASVLTRIRPLRIATFLVLESVRRDATSGSNDGSQRKT